MEATVNGTWGQWLLVLRDSQGAKEVDYLYLLSGNYFRKNNFLELF